MKPTNRSPQGQHFNVRGVNFFCNAPQAHLVSLVGDFNRWNPRASPLQRQADGSWFLRLDFSHGHHRYAFMVDDVVTLDPQAMGITRDDRGERVSLIAVS